MDMILVDGEEHAEQYMTAWWPTGDGLPPDPLPWTGDVHGNHDVGGRDRHQVVDEPRCEHLAH